MAVTWGFRCASWGIVSSLVAAVLCSRALSSEPQLAIRVLSGAFAILLSISSLIAFHISSLRCSESHTLISLLLSYKFHEEDRLATPFIMAKANHIWRHPRKAQEDLIRELTKRHTKTEYGRKNRLGEIRSLEDLRKVHPFTTYEHFKGYIRRLADGEEGVFLDEKPARFGVTSGTTGDGKLIPYTGFWLAGDAQGRQLDRWAVYKGSSRPSSVQKRCYLYAHPSVSATKTGIIVCPYLIITKRGLLRYFDHSSPPPAFSISDEPTAAYIHMLFAIANRNLAQLSAMFIPQIYRALRCLETNWQAMLEDLSTGQINAKLPLDPDVRRSLQGYLRPDQGRVSQLRREFEKGFVGIVKRIWPHLAALQGIDVNGFQKKLQEKYCRGIPFVSGAYGGTEAGTVGVNMWINEEEPRYVLLPSLAIFEFIPEKHNSEEDPKSLLIDEVEVGERYELVQTTLGGLYRYRNGDMIEVAGFLEKCPVIRMLYRIGEYLNLIYEKTNTSVVETALKATMGVWPELHLVDWTCAESLLLDTESSELYYILFVEVDPGEGTFPLNTAEQRSKFDEFLQQHQYYYKSLRASSTISMAQVHLLRPGTFMELRDSIVSRTTASINQYKTPRKVRTTENLQWLMERVVETK